MLHRLTISGHGTMARINAGDAFLVVTDVQDKLLSLLRDYEETLFKIKLVARALKSAGLPMILTEHNPLVFGDTEKELRALFAEPPVVKFSFSGFGAEEFARRVRLLKRKTMVITGFEAHVCVQQTIIDAVAGGFTVFAVSDAIGAVSNAEKKVAMNRYGKEGAVVTTAESLIFELCGDSHSDMFKRALPFIKELRSKSLA